MVALGMNQSWVICINSNKAILNNHSFFMHLLES